MSRFPDQPLTYEEIVIIKNRLKQSQKESETQTMNEDQEYLNAINSAFYLNDTDPEDIQLANEYLPVLKLLVKHGVKSTLDAIIDLGPMPDGNVPSKAENGFLIDLGLVVKICSGGQQGYNAATYFGWSMMQAIKYLEKNKKEVVTCAN